MSQKQEQGIELGEEQACSRQQVTHRVQTGDKEVSEWNPSHGE